MASTTTMVRPPAGRPPPPPPSGNRPKPPPPKKAPPPPPSKRAPPPPPPKSAPKPPPAAVNGKVIQTLKRDPTDDGNSALKRGRNNEGNAVFICAPVVLRDVNVFTKEHQVGQGTYGSVFVGCDKITKEVVALKRINTEQEENGFPITAIREVKILKALKHENIVELKEIVTSKGA